MLPQAVCVSSGETLGLIVYRVTRVACNRRDGGTFPLNISASSVSSVAM